MINQAKPDGTRRDGILLLTWILAAAIVLTTVIVRIRLLGMPLERDEGEFAYMGQLILKGVPPYKLAYNMKLPGIYAIYALIMAVFGQSAVGIRLGFLLTTLMTTVLVFMLGRRLWNTQVGLFAATAYPVLTLGRAVYGLAAHATHFQMPMVLGAVILLLKALESGRRRLLFWAGLLMGLAFITKQQAFPFIAFGACYLLWELLRSRLFSARSAAARMGIYMGGAVAPYALTCLLMYATGVFDKFWFWTVTYARLYASEMPLDTGMALLGTCLQGAYVVGFLLALAVIGLIGVWCDKRFRAHAVLTSGFFLFSFLAFSMGLYYRPHYMVQIMPAVALLIGLGVVWIGRLLSRLRYRAVLQVIPILLFAGAVAHAFLVSADLFFQLKPEGASHAMYGLSPFPESVTVARFIKQHTKPGDRIAVIGSEPQIYFYADRPSATGYIYAYGMMEEQEFAVRMQKDMVREIEASKPKYVVLVRCPGSWLMRPESNPLVIYWFARYASQHYRVVGLADIVSRDRTNYYWGEDAYYLAPDALTSLCIFERKDSR